MHIFISYSKADTRDLALQLRDAVMALPGVTAWMDTSLHSGEDWAAQIQDEIDRADLVVVLLSQDVNRPANHTNGRSFVLKEIHYAQQGKKTIIPVMAQATRVPVQLAGIEYINFARDPSSGVQRLIQEITTRAGVSVPTNLSTAARSMSTPRPFTPAQPRVQSSPTTASPANLANYRRPAFIIGFIVLILIIVAAAVILPSLNPPTLLTPTTNIGLLPSDSPAPTLPTATPILTLTNTPQPISTAVPPTATLTPRPPTITFTPTLPLGFATAAHNADWTPHYQTFNGFEMALVPVGCFMMGSIDGDDNEKPVDQQCFDQPFWLDRYEVTNKQYGSISNFEGDTRPRDNVSWIEARDFCAARGARLPTEREWEYAARGPDNLVYPWGNEFVADNVVIKDNSNGQTSNVGSRPIGNSWIGASDLSGNVWEWVSTIYGVDNNGDGDLSDSGDKLFPYPYDASDGREKDSEDEIFIRGLRGGSWIIYSPIYGSTYRNYELPNVWGVYNGFRCVRSVTTNEISSTTPIGHPNIKPSTGTRWHLSLSDAL